MADIVAFVEHDMYVRNFLSSGAFDGLLARGSLRISASELVDADRLRPWDDACTERYRRHPTNRAVVQSFNKLSIRRYRRLSSTFDIKVRTAVPFGRYSPREIVKSTRGIYDLWVRPGLPARIGENPTLEAVIARERPRLAIFIVTGVESTGYELIALSRRHGFRTLFLVNGWDNLSSKGVFGVLPDYLGLWGPQSLVDAVTIHGLPSHRGFLLGCARYEPYFRERRPGGSPFPFPYVLFAGSTTPYDELTPLRMLDETVAREGLAPLRIVYRPHPWREKRACDDLFDAGRFRHALLDPQLEREYYANKRAGSESVASPTMPELDYYPRLLEHAAFVVSPMSSMTLEAALFDVPAIVLANDDGVHRLTGAQVARYRHFEGGREVAGWQFVDELRELPATFSRLHALTRHDGPGRRHFAPALAHSMAPYLFVDRRSYAERLLQATDVILERAGSGRPAPAVAR